ncbi:amidohydrolase family protein [Microbacteriaceae bacterium VKM Ac-2854]|nr:amidohydrolase family protein [Microbacteriaceae bacterium VKM Ac-2854]
MSTLLRGGTVVDPVDGMRLADVIVDAAGIRFDGAFDEVRDVTGMYLLPGSIDAHSHADARILDDDVQLALLRQGVTTVIVGQDGVGFTPGSGDYARSYFGSLNGVLRCGPRVRDQLAAYDGATRLGVGVLVPAGTLRAETGGVLPEMRRLVAEGMADGALGLSSGLDYTPGRFADAAELTALCAVLDGGVYVSHVRGYEAELPRGFAEFAQIVRGAGVRGHVSHLHAVESVLAEVLASDVDFSFDAYPYDRGFTLLSMMMSNPADVAARAAAITVASGPSWAEGRDLVGVDVAALLAEDPNTSVVAAFPTPRDDAELERLFADPRAMGGSDGIFLGGAPHPRAYGCFARMYSRFAPRLGWVELARMLALRPAERFGLGARGRIAAGFIADVVVADPAAFTDRASYAEPRLLAEGVREVYVDGVAVLRDGALTAALPGGGVRWC